MIDERRGPNHEGHRFEHDVLTVLGDIETKLDRILAKLTRIEKKEILIMADLTALTTQVQANTDVEASAILLLQGLSAQITAMKNDPVALQALADQLKTSQAALAAAIVANTPAA